MGRSQAHLQSIAGIPPALLDQQLCSSQICSTIGASVHAFVLTGLVAAATTGTARQSEEWTHPQQRICLSAEASQYSRTVFLRKEPPLHSQEMVLDRQPTPQQDCRQLRSVGQTFSHVAALSGHDVLPVAVRSPLNDCLLSAGEQGLCLRLGSVWKWVQGLGRVDICIPKRPAISSPCP